MRTLASGTVQFVMVGLEGCFMAVFGRLATGFTGMEDIPIPIPIRMGMDTCGEEVLDEDAERD